uniref:Solute carrier family 35 member E4 n=1 Tax=Scophthalmus maximus TaxID=52904 RepID=A0A8D3BR32_SCOMX
MISANGFSKCEATQRERGRKRPPAEMLHLLSAVIVWLVTGTTISSLNKWIFAVYNFRYPLLLSALHMLTAIVVNYGLIKLRVIHHRGAGEQDLTASAKSSHPQIHGHDAHLPGSLIQHPGGGPVRSDRLLLCVRCNHAEGRQVHSAEHLTSGGENQLCVPALPDVHSEFLHLDCGCSGLRELDSDGVAAALRPRTVGLHPAQLHGVGHVQLGELPRHHAHLGRHPAHPRQPERGGEPAVVAAAVRQRAVCAQLRRCGVDTVWHAHLSELGVHRPLSGRAQLQS